MAVSSPVWYFQCTVKLCCIFCEVKCISKQTERDSKSCKQLVMSCLQQLWASKMTWQSLPDTPKADTPPTTDTPVTDTPDMTEMTAMADTPPMADTAMAECLLWLILPLLTCKTQLLFSSTLLCFKKSWPVAHWLPLLGTDVDYYYCC